MEPEKPGAQNADRAPMQALGRLAATWILLPLFFWASGGSLGWWEAWVYCGILLGPMTIFICAAVRHDPAFLARRFKLREKERDQHRIQNWGSIPFLAALIIPGLDHRFHWSNPPLAAIVAALALVLAGYLLILRTFLENRWAGRTVEIWTGQAVVSTGPYAVVRHPMYLGTIILLLATSVALGSWWTMIPVFTVISVMVLRIRSEEEMLLHDLPDYREYRQKVPYRLVPFLW